MRARSDAGTGQYVSIAQFSRLSGLPNGLIRRMVHDGQLPVLHSGRCAYLPVQRCLEILESSLEGGGVMAGSVKGLCN